MNGPYTDKVTGCRRLSWKERVPIFDNGPCRISDIRGQDNAGIRGSVRISRDAEDMLVKARRKPYLTMTALYREVGLSGYKGLKCKRELIRAGLADEVELPTNRRGRRKKLLQIMPRGTEYLKTLGITQGPKGRGGVKHIYYQRMLRDWYQAHGYTTEIEATIGGTCLDLLVIRKDGTRLGIEIALSEQYEDVNVLKALEAGIEHLLFVSESEKVKERIGRKVDSMVQGQTRSKVGFKLVSDYFRRFRKHAGSE